jgi:hypothetical protein
MAASSCQRLGQELVNGRPASKWQITTTGKQGSSRALEWIDLERGLVLRRESAAGLEVQQQLLGTEQLHGRQVEKWEKVTIGSGYLPKSSLHWFDPELNLDIREEHPGGYIYELRNIRVAKQPESLFVIPAGFDRVAGRH